MASALTVVRLKTARHTVTRPVQIGAALAGAAPEEVAALAGFGDPLGDAFQLRDDLLGVFGDPAVTGKSNLDDLREGKPTVLLALARASASRPARPGWGNWSAIPVSTRRTRPRCGTSSRSPAPGRRWSG
ncbi:polyprenyl synthetase family protein [Micromonospora sp. BRA006-A]|nr:polyprenyl synthetase family protein [Micromonospora sp. BRA006-A]